MKYRIFLGFAALAGTAILVAQLNAEEGAGNSAGRSGGGAVGTADNDVGGGIAGGGPDVVYTNVGGISDYGPIGGIRGYALGSYTCNVGDQDLLWTNNGTPGLAMNAYRLYDGRLMQIGMSWVKHACCAAAGNGCGLACNGHGGNVLGAGCLDVYSSGWNAIQSKLGPRSGIDPYSGAFSAIPGGAGDAIFRRLQIAESDLDANIYPGALYFVEGVYVGTDDAQNANWLNNASYKQVTVGGDFSLVETGRIQSTIPAIFAWHDHGNGPNNPDPSVETVNVDLPGEGRFVVGAKASDSGGGTWRYDYAVFNLNSHRSAGVFSVPIPSGAIVSGVGFHDVDYHSGEVYDTADWIMSVTDTEVTWSSPETFAENANTNALRWGTMYNFWFEADVQPVEGEVTLGLFRPGAPGVVSATVSVPGSLCSADLDGDGSVGILDLLALLAAWGANPGHPADFDGDGTVGILDLLTLLADWGPCP